MTISEQIANARKHLATGNTQSYAQVMAGMIRSAKSDRAVKAFRIAIQQDGTADYFVSLNTACPLARA